MEVSTDPIPTMAAPPTAERISSFLSCIRQSAADDDMATTASAAETLATPLPPDVHVDACGGATANAASFSPDVAGGPADGATATAPPTAIPGAAAPAGASQLPPPANSVSGDDAVAAPPVAATRKRKVRGSHNDVAKDERKRQRHAAFLLATQGDTEAGT